ncbi:MAG: rod shape-determining protein [Oscillospiraceae bacterium]|nr:rod shape-determining protein [Oscillospiraceae bacterium]
MYKFSRDLGVDLGTANVLIYADGKGIVLREPAVVAVDKNTGNVIRVGSEARSMMGRTPVNVEAVRPLRGGAISDYDMTEKLLSGLMRKAVGYSLVKPRVVISVPSGITEVEERAVIQAAIEAGARRAYLLEEPLAAALGAELDISEAKGRMVVNIGGGVTDIAVISMNNVATSSSVRAGGDSFDAAVVQYVRKHYSILIGESAAEEVKIAIGGVAEREEPLTMQVKGRDLKTGLPREETVTSTELFEAFKRPLRVIMDEILSVLEQTAPELVSDLTETGILLTGGGSQLYGMAETISQRTEIPCRVADDPDACVVLGCGKSLKWLSSMQEGTVNLARRKIMREQ